MFHSQTLAKAISELETTADNIKNRADQSSEDIKKLEKYLSQKFIGIEIGINVQDHKIDEDHMKVFELAGMSSVLQFLMREFLFWKKDETTKKFRLIYETHSLKGDKINGYKIWPEKKPLIECSLFDRLRMHEKLYLLVEHIKKLV